MKKKTKKLIKALEDRIETVEDRCTLALDFLNETYEAQTKFFSSRLEASTMTEFFKSVGKSFDK